MNLRYLNLLVSCCFIAIGFGLVAIGHILADLQLSPANMDLGSFVNFFADADENAEKQLTLILDQTNTIIIRISVAVDITGKAISLGSFVYALIFCIWEWKIKRASVAALFVLCLLPGLFNSAHAQSTEHQGDGPTIEETEQFIIELDRSCDYEYSSYHHTTYGRNRSIHDYRKSEFSFRNGEMVLTNYFKRLTRWERNKPDETTIKNHTDTLKLSDLSPEVEIEVEDRSNSSNRSGLYSVVFFKSGGSKDKYRFYVCSDDQAQTLSRALSHLIKKHGGKASLF